MEINRFPQCLKSIVFLFQSLEKAGREGEVGIKGALEKDAPPTDLYPDVFPAPQGAPHQDPLMGFKNTDLWIHFFWSLLFPEKFSWREEAGGYGAGGWVAQEEIEPRTEFIVLGLLSSPLGRQKLFEMAVDRLRKGFGLPPPGAIWELCDSLRICPACGKLFIRNRKSQRFCSDSCRKRANAVPSKERKDPTTARIYFWRKVEEGYSREYAWQATLTRHETKLKELGLYGPHPPTSWAKKGV